MSTQRPIGKFTTLVIMNNNQKPKLPKMSSNRSIENKSCYIHMLDYYSAIKNHILHIHNMNESHRHYTEQKKLDTKKSVHTV